MKVTKVTIDSQKVGGKEMWHVSTPNPMVPGEFYFLYDQPAEAIAAAAGLLIHGDAGHRPRAFDTGYQLAKSELTPKLESQEKNVKELQKELARVKELLANKEQDEALFKDFRGRKPEQFDANGNPVQGFRVGDIWLSVVNGRVEQGIITSLGWT